MKIVIFSVMGLLVASAASAESKSTQKWTAYDKAGGKIGDGSQFVEGVSAVAPPPRGYGPEESPPAINARFGLPPEPDGTIAPRTHEAWRRAIRASRETPQIAKTAIKHEPVRAKHSTENSAAGSTSSNWSGTSIIGGNTESIEAVAAMFVVPTPRVPFGTCDQTYYYSSYWPGIDGNGGAGFNDVLQGGLEIAAICINGITSGYTIPWVEWYPAYSVGVSAPAMNPGDLVFVEVWNTSPTQGYVFFYNYSTDSSAEYSVTAPPGTAAYGSSVEWIVERPTVGNVLANLANYVASPWSERVAWNYANPNPTVYWMGATPDVGTIENLTMVDNTNQPISSVTIEGPNFLWFENSGSSCGANQQPC